MALLISLQLVAGHCLGRRRRPHRAGVLDCRIVCLLEVVGEEPQYTCRFICCPFRLFLYLEHLQLLRQKCDFILGFHMKALIGCTINLGLLILIKEHSILIITHLNLLFQLQLYLLEALKLRLQGFVSLAALPTRTVKHHIHFN